MPRDILLDELLDGPTLAVEIGGRRLLFSELPLAAVARLQGWLRQNVPHPVSALAGRLDGLADADRRHLLDRAHDEARSWPPAIGSPEAARALLSNESGLIETLYEGLLVHQPDSTRDDARLLLRAMERRVRKAIRAAAEAARAGADQPSARRPAEVDDVMRLTAVLFGNADDDEGPGLPKGPAAAATTAAAIGG